MGRITTAPNDNNSPDEQLSSAAPPISKDAASLSNEEIFRAFFNANTDDYMAYWDMNLDLKLANFPIPPEHLPLIEGVLHRRKPARFEASHDGRVYRYRAYPAMNALGDCKGVALFANDISAAKETEKEVHRLAYYDLLTDLPNQALLNDRLNQAILSAKRHNHYGAVLYLNLDRLQNVNDSMGRAVGDQVLIFAAQKLDQVRRDEDTIARVGGDEFVWTLPDVGKNAESAARFARRAAQRLISALNEPLEIGNHELRVSCCVGISLFGDEDVVDVAECFKQADTAMHGGKRQGAGTVQFFQPHMQKSATERFVLETRLHDAVDNENLDIFYQPQAELSTGVLVGAETLLRWTDKELGFVSPGKFIPIAEDTGKIIKIGDWVLDRVCRQIGIWNAEESGPPLSRIAINISPIQFREDAFVEKVCSAIARWSIDPGQLELELTEGIVIDDVDATIEKMFQLRKLGVRFAIDDFGTGYSSLAYLSKLPLDILKIDQSFVRDLESDQSSAAIINSIVTMAKLLGFEIVAEGVETTDQASFLCDQGCEVYQGYLLNRPAPLSDFKKFLSTYRPQQIDRLAAT